MALGHPVDTGSQPWHRQKVIMTRLLAMASSTDRNRQHTNRPTKKNPIAQNICALVRSLRGEDIEKRQIVFFGINRRSGVLPEAFEFDMRQSFFDLIFRNNVSRSQPASFVLNSGQTGQN